MFPSFSCGHHIHLWPSFGRLQSLVALFHRLKKPGAATWVQGPGLCFSRHPGYTGWEIDPNKRKPGRWESSEKWLSSSPGNQKVGVVLSRKARIDSQGVAIINLYQAGQRRTIWLSQNSKVHALANGRRLESQMYNPCKWQDSDQLEYTCLAFKSNQIDIEKWFSLFNPFYVQYTSECNWLQVKLWETPSQGDAVWSLSE